jgi:hypothetical protein
MAVKLSSVVILVVTQRGLVGGYKHFGGMCHDTFLWEVGNHLQKLLSSLIYMCQYNKGKLGLRQKFAQICLWRVNY